MPNQLNTSDLDFNSLKASIKTYLQSQSEFNDWDFDGSGLNVLLDVLAYNTQQNALTSHLALNEAFLDSAQLRNNVVAHAKLLGYVPRSVTASSVKVDIVVSGGGNSGDPNDLVLARGTKFTAIQNGEQYNFIVNETTVSDPVNSDGEYHFNNVELKEGTYKALAFKNDVSINNQRFEIPEDNVDINSIEVSAIVDNRSINYFKFTNISGLDETSLVYFIQENINQKYEIYFGDDVIGRLPDNLTRVDISYIYSQGANGNRLKVFNAAENIEGFSNISVSLNSSNTGSYGGKDREGIESIRHNAPLAFVSQNRAVTADDYKTIILNDFGAVDAISVWGGENDPEPKYGTVYISIKPLSGNTLSDAQKTEILSLLDGKNIITITPEFVDPEYTQLRLSVFFKYNLKQTNKSKAELTQLVSDTVGTYNDDYLNKFDGVYRQSEFLGSIDDADIGILSSNVYTYMFKTITTSVGIANTFDIQFAGKIESTSQDEPIMTKVPFTYNGISYFLQDEPITGSVDRMIYRYRINNGTKIRSAQPYGRIFTTEGRVTLSNLRTDTAETLIIEVPPASYDIAPSRNELIQIDETKLVVSGELDTISAGGSAGAKNYKTTIRQ